MSMLWETIGIISFGGSLGICVGIKIGNKLVHKLLDLNNKLTKLNDDQFSLITKQKKSIDDLTAISFKLNKEAEDWYAKCCILSQKIIQLDPNVTKVIIKQDGPKGEIN